LIPSSMVPEIFLAAADLHIQAGFTVHSWFTSWLSLSSTGSDR
jgi:hypothetical protein